MSSMPTWCELKVDEVSGHDLHADAGTIVKSARFVLIVDTEGMADEYRCLCLAHYRWGSASLCVVTAGSTHGVAA